MMETTLAYWCANGCLPSPLAALIWLLAGVWVAFFLRPPERKK